MKCLVEEKSPTHLSRMGAIACGSISLTVGMLCLTTSVAQAQPAYGSYVGVGGSFGLTSGAENEPQDSSIVIAARYRLLEIPVSLRAQILTFSNSTAIVPTVSYDIPINWQTDAYIGAGVAFQSGGDTSPIGNQTSFVLQPGVDYSLPNSNLVLFGNAIIAFDAYRDSGGAAASLQGGVGLRF